MSGNAGRIAVSMIAWSFGVACGSSHTTPDEDADITIDAGDASPDAVDDTPPDTEVDSGPPVGVCGDGMLDWTEQCDDGNGDNDDACSNECVRSSYCGDGTTDDGEECDDDNNSSGDGCRSDCLSNETCGNGILDFAAGEHCDDGNTEGDDFCSASCDAIPSCGDGVLDDGEACDDTNTDSWDGCSSLCLDEHSLILTSLTLGSPDEGCDYSGDGEPDNSLAEAFGIGASFVAGMIEDQFSSGAVIVALTLLGLDDPTGTNDESFRTILMPGTDTDDDASNNFSGEAEIHGSSMAFDEDGVPTTSLESEVANNIFIGGPEDIDLPVGLLLPLQLNQGRMHGTTTSGEGYVSGMEDGLLCGAMPLSTLGLLPNLVTMYLGSSPPPCDGSSDEGSMADILVAGAMFEIPGVPIPLSIGGVPPDVDIDGDGLESFRVDSTGADGCQPVVTACFDGDGTLIDGRACYLDARIQDGYSTGLPFEATRVFITGLE